MTQDESYRQKLDDRARSLNYWLAAAGVLTTLVLAKGIALDFLTSQRLTDLADQAETEFWQIQARAEAVETTLGLSESALRNLERSAVSSALTHGGDWADTAEIDVFLGYLGYDSFLDTTGELREDQIVGVGVSLEVGEEYRFVAVCDGYCSDLDLMLHADAKRVEIDELPDALPMIDYSPNESGEFEVVVSMFSCQAEDGCEWRLRGFVEEEPEPSGM